MKNTFEIENYIYDLWAKKNLSFAQIAQMEIPNFLSLKRVRNICYAPREKAKSKTEFGVRMIFRLKYLDNKNINKSIKFAYKNQPPTKISESSVRRIIRKKTKVMQTKKSNSQLPTPNSQQI
ncbi:MAG: hypothetical protein FWF72_06765 [Paludibacter sp.]|nr:hypothetical protein [Paludibacter sp.]